MWVEIGSSNLNWGDEKAGDFLAKTIMDFFSINISFPKRPVILGIGGLHHTPNFSKLILDQKVYVGHVCPKYLLSSVTIESLEHAIQNTFPKVSHIVYDWKSLTEKERLIPLIESLSSKYNLVIAKSKDL